VIDAISRFSGMAFDHARRKKMILEGYCGLASHALAYVTARPRRPTPIFKVGRDVRRAGRAAQRCREPARSWGSMPEDRPGGQG